MNLTLYVHQYDNDYKAGQMRRLNLSKTYWDHMRVYTTAFSLRTLILL